MARLTRESRVQITLIVALGALALVLLGFASMSGCLTTMRSMGGLTEMGNASVDAQDVTSLDVGWGSGEARVVVVDDAEANGQVQLIETATGNVSRGQQMRWGISNGTLKVDYGSGFSCSMLLGRRDLEVRIPKSAAERLDAVRLTGASGSFAAAGLTCRTLDVEIASGQMDVRDMRADELTVNVASGQVDVAGRFEQSVRMKTASGQTRVECLDVCPQSANIQVASGSTTFAVPDSDGFTVHLDKASGSFSTSFATKQEGRAYVYGDGSSRIDVNLASGDVKLEKS